MHVGIDTVASAAKGFERSSQPGARVQRGDPLLKFDLDVLARRAKSLITPIVVTNGEQFAIVVRCVQDRSVEVGDGCSSCSVEQRRCRQPPQRRCAKRARRFVDYPGARHPRAAGGADRELRQRRGRSRSAVAAHGRSANARSAVALMSLGVRRGDEVTIVGDGQRCGRGRRAS